MPTEPLPSIWEFRTSHLPDERGIVGIGADLEAGTLLCAYRNGLFPMPISGPANQRVMGWWSPDPRCILPLDRLRVTRSLKRSYQRFEIRVDAAFDDVIDACADPRRSGSWITPQVQQAYITLHQLGWAHSVETWDLASNTLVGGLYGVSIGGLFAGESMFHRKSDASKVALMGLVSLLRTSGERALLDVQWMTPHLETLGAIEVPRAKYLQLLKAALEAPAPDQFA